MERANGVDADGEDELFAPNIATDREELAGYEPFEAVYTRAGRRAVNVA